MSYEVPVMVLSMDMLQNYCSAEDYEWLQANPADAEYVLDQAAEIIETFLDDTGSVDTAIEQAIENIRY